MEIVVYGRAFILYLYFFVIVIRLKGFGWKRVFSGVFCLIFRMVWGKR